MNIKKYLLVWLTAVFIIISIIGFINYKSDIYGINTLENKFINLTTTNNHIRILDKLNAEVDYYLIGTSRLLRVDPLMVEKYFKKSVRNINISGSSFYENLYLVQKVKEKSSNVIYGFDAFSLNENRKQLDRLEVLYEKEKNYNYEHVYQFFTTDYLNNSILYKFYEYIGKDINYAFNKENAYKPNKPTFKDIQKELDVYANYEIVPNAQIKKLAKTFTKNDIVIIYPKYYMYYKYFQKNYELEEKYFDALRILVNNTDAKVYSFYGINKLTTDYRNYDNSGWHFKPKIADKIFKCISQNNCSNMSGYLLTSENIENTLNNIQSDVNNYKSFMLMQYFTSSLANNLHSL